MTEGARSFIKIRLLAGVGIHSWIRKVQQAISIRTRLEKAFSDIYLNNLWEDPESVSGRGSTLARTGIIRAELLSLLESVGAKSLLDAPCGDFNWMRRVDLRGVEYIGADVVRELIVRNRRLYGGKGRNFVVLDITSDELPKVDVILCRDCLIHFSFEHARAAIANFKRSGSTFLLATTHGVVEKNTDIKSGEWRSVNLRLPPYNFPEPLRLIVENPDTGKSLGMWRLEDLSVSS